MVAQTQATLSLRKKEGKIKDHLFFQSINFKVTVLNKLCKDDKVDNDRKCFPQLCTCKNMLIYTVVKRGYTDVLA